MYWCMEANHILRNVFSIDLDLPKSNLFTSAPAMLGSRVATNQQNFYSTEPLTWLPSPLENSEALGVYPLPHTCHIILLRSYLPSYVVVLPCSFTESNILYCMFYLFSFASTFWNTGIDFQRIHLTVSAKWL